MKIKFNWSRYNGYEISTRGDARFSAFNAKMPDGRSIEMHYQCDIKGYDIGGCNWRMGKGKPPLKNMTHDEQWKTYCKLWFDWCDRNKPLIAELKNAAIMNNCTLCDRFANTTINQARALAEYLNKF